MQRWTRRLGPVAGRATTALALVLGAAATIAFAAQDKGGHDDHDHGHADAQDAGGPDAAMMAAWEKYMTPGEEHARLAELVGDWDLEVKMFMAPGAPPSVSRATATYAMDMGGRYLVERVKGEFEGQPFEGMGVTGYDNARKAYVFTWIDSAGTGIMHGVGHVDETGKALRTTAWSTDPLTGKEKKTRGVDRHVDANTKVSEMYDTLPDGTEFKAMEIVYTRKNRK